MPNANHAGVGHGVPVTYSIAVCRGTQARCLERAVCMLGQGVKVICTLNTTKKPSF